MLLIAHKLTFKYDQMRVTSKILSEFVKTPAKLFPYFTSSPFYHLLISWETNGAEKSTKN